MEVKHNLSETLTEVRKAYRLIAAYQRRLLDMAKVIQGHFDYKPYWHYNTNYDIRSNRVATDRWSIDMLPMYHGFLMLFLPQKADNNFPKKDEWLLEIGFNNDSGYKTNNNREPDPLEFDKPADSKSFMTLNAFGVVRDMKNTNWLNFVHKNTDWPSDEKIVQNMGYGTWAAGKSYDMAELVDENALMEKIIDFKAFIEEKKKELQI